MNAKLVYLCGPINGCTDDEAKNWRAFATSQLATFGTSVIDPMRHDYRGREHEEGIAATIVNDDKNDILNSDAVFVYYEKPSIGTSMEVFFAHQQCKRVVVLNQSKTPNVNLSPWLKHHSTFITVNWPEAIELAVRGFIAW